MSSGPGGAADAPVLESALRFECEGDALVGVLHRRSDQASGTARHALVVAVGGGQYRVGAHRQFVSLARDLAAAGVPVLRFDVRGMGDAEGEPRHFLSLDADLAAAVDAVEALVRPRRGTLLWGLCDGATAALLHAPRNPLVRGVALVNPWITTGSGRARTLLRHHYAARALDPRFWKALASGRVAIGASLRSFAAMIGAARRGGTRGDAAAGTDADDPEAGMVERVFAALAGREAGSTLVVVSERDLTAREFEDELARRGTASPAPVRIDADHTFSTREARERLSRETLAWVRSMDGPEP